MNKLVGSDNKRVCAIYARLDRKKRMTIEHQIERCREEILRNGWELAPLEAFVDDGRDSILAQEHRPGFGRMLKAVRREDRLFDCLVVESTTRLSRCTSEVLSTFSRLSREGVSIHLLPRSL